MNGDGSSYINDHRLVFSNDFGIGGFQLRAKDNNPYVGVFTRNINNTIDYIPLKGAYPNREQNEGYYVTDTYLNSAEYRNSAGFVKRSGDTMDGDLDMYGYKIFGVMSIEFTDATETKDISIICTKNANEDDYGLKLTRSTGTPVEIMNIAEPTEDNSAVNLAYLKEYCEGKTQEVTLTGVVDTILAHNTEYTIKDFTALTLVCDSAKTAENHGYIKFPNVPIVPTLTGFSKIDGDDITQAAANETWEFSCFKGYMLFKNWGVAA